MCDGQIPEDWIHAPLGELGNITTGSTPPTSMPQNYGGDIPFVGPADLGDFRSITSSSKSVTEFGARQSRTLEAKAVLVSCIGILGKTGQADQLLTFNQQINAIAPYPSKVDPTFLYYLCNTLGRTLEKLAGLQVIPIVNKREFSTITRPVPRSLHEQKKIAKILDTLDTQIQKTEALIGKLEKIKEGLLHDLLTRGIDQNGLLRPTPEQAPELFKESDLGLIPRKWDVSDLGASSLSSVIGPFGSDLVASDYRSDGVPVVFVRDIASATYSRVSQVFVSHGKAKALSAHEVKPGDLLLTKMGLPPCISAVYPQNEPAGIITADVVRLRLKADVAPKWAHYFVNSEAVKSQVRGITAGVTRPKVTLKDVRSLRIAVPDSEEQVRILSVVQHSSRRLESEGANLEKLKAQKSGLMEDLLTGKVRVTPLLRDAG